MVATVAVAAWGFVLAQPTPEQISRGKQMVEERFAAAAPDIGEPVPDVTLLDADGKERQLRALVEGNYSVLVLGCLT